VYLYGWKTSQKHETSSNELASCIWRQVDAGKRWKVGYGWGMAENVGGLAFPCICTAEKEHGKTKRVQMNSFRGFRGGLTQRIDGKSGVRGYG